MSYIKLLVSSFSFIKFQYEVDHQAYFRLWGEKQQQICEHMNKQENSTIKNRTAWLINLCLHIFPQP